MEYTYYAYIYAWFFRYSFIFLSSIACAISQDMIKAANASLINLIIWLNIFLKSFYTVLSLGFFSGIDIFTTTKMWPVCAKMGRLVGMSKIYTGRSIFQSKELWRLKENNNPSSYKAKNLKTVYRAKKGKQTNETQMLVHLY